MQKQVPKRYEDISYSLRRVFVFNISQQFFIHCLDPEWQNGPIAARRYTENNHSFPAHNQQLLCDFTAENAPNPAFLKVHASLGKILHASGRAKEYDQLLSPDGESIGVVAPEVELLMSRVLNSLDVEGWKLEVGS